MVDVWSWITFGLNNLCMPPEFKDVIVANRNFSDLFEKRKKVCWKSPKSSDLGNFLRLFLAAGFGFWFGISRFCQKNDRIQYRSIHCILYSYIYSKWPSIPQKLLNISHSLKTYVSTVRYDIFISHLFIFRLLLPIFASTNLTYTSYQYTFLFTNPWFCNTWFKNLD